jgi:hypothetical protein
MGGGINQAGDEQGMKIPDEVKTVILKPSDMKLLGAAAVFLIVFVVGFIIDSARLMDAGIFFCIVVQGMRR